MSRDDPTLLLDILVAARQALKFSAGLTKDDFGKSHLHQCAVTSREYLTDEWECRRWPWAAMRAPITPAPSTAARWNALDHTGGTMLNEYSFSQGLFVTAVMWYATAMRLSPEIEAFMRAKVTNGRYTSVDEVLRKALELLEERDRRRLGKQPKRTAYRNRETAWLRSHAADLATHRGKWVVLEGENILASEAEYQLARRQATSAGIQRPLIFFVPDDAKPFMGAKTFNSSTPFPIESCRLAARSFLHSS